MLKKLKSNRCKIVNQEPLRFHSVHGKEIQLSNDRLKATRSSTSFCNGILFSSRPLVIGEPICFRLNTMSNRWRGALRIGFSAHDPAGLCQLPKCAVPDLTSKPGYWGKALPESINLVHMTVHFYVSGSGKIYVGVDGHDLGVFFSGIDTRHPLWAMIDLYGNCTSMELIDYRNLLNNNNNTMVPSHISMRRPSASTQPHQRGHHQEVVRRQCVSERQRRLQQEQLQQLIEDQRRSSLESNGSSRRSSESNSTPVFQRTSERSLNPMSFHKNVGLHVKLDRGCCVAERDAEEFAQGYVFSSRNLSLGEKIVIKVLRTEDTYVGSMAFGLTTCNPASIRTQNLPEDSDLLLDRPEYWVVSKDVASSPVSGDEVSFKVNRDGSVEFSKNNGPSVVFMYVDVSQPLWAFFDIYGQTQTIEILGSIPESSQRVTSSPSPCSLPSLSPTPSCQSMDVNRSQQEPPSECAICFENEVDCVLYSCGHMCLCYDCAVKQWTSRTGGFCPVCRSPIRDVIKTYQA